MIKRMLNPKNIYDSQGGISNAKVMFYGKPYIAQIYARTMRGANALFKADQFKLRNGKYSIVFEKLIRSAVANGKQKGLDTNDLYVSRISVGRGRFLKRRQWHGKGRSGSLDRPFTHINLELKEVKGVS